MELYYLLKAGSELRLRLKPDIDYYTRRAETEEGKSIKEILTDIGVNPGFVALAGKIRLCNNLTFDIIKIERNPNCTCCSF